MNSVFSIDMVDILKKYADRADGDFEKCGQGVKTRCVLPGHSDTNPSFLMYENIGKGWYFHCEKCGKGGNSIQLLCAMGIAKDTTKARELLEHDFNIAPPDKWTLDSFAEYKGLDVELLRRYEWSETAHGLRVPYISVDGTVMYAAKIRHHAGDTVKYTFEFKDKSVPYGLQSLNNEDKSKVYIAEGETDCMTLIQAGFSAIGVSGCNGWDSSFAEYLAPFQKVIVTQDNDDAGKKLVNAIRKDITDKLFVLKQTNSIKDINDYHITRCNCDTGVFKAGFENISIYPATIESYIQYLEENKNIIADKDSITVIIDDIRNEVIREGFIKSINKITGVGKTVIKKVITDKIKENDTVVREEYEDFMLNSDGKVLTNIENIEVLLRRKGVELYYDVIRKNIFIKQGDKSSILKNMDISIIKNYFINMEVYYSDADVMNFMEVIARKNERNCVTEYLQASYEANKAKLDGTDYLKDLFSCLHLKDGGSAFDYVLFRKWFLQAIQIAHNDSGLMKAENCLVLSGAQGIYKTTFFNKIVPNKEWFKDGVILNLSDKDDKIKVFERWIVELGELDGTFKGDQSKLKAFLSERTDSLRPPYARIASNYNRTTAFCASVNKHEFLKDETGNRRWWILEVDSIDMCKVDSIDINLVWAYVYATYIEGKEAWWIEGTENDELKYRNENYTFVTDLELLIREDIIDRDNTPVRVASTDIIKLVKRFAATRDVEVDFKNIKNIFTKLGIQPKNTNKANGYLVPLKQSLIDEMNSGTHDGGF